MAGVEPTLELADGEDHRAQRSWLERPLEDLSREAFERGRAHGAAVVLDRLADEVEFRSEHAPWPEALDAAEMAGPLLEAACVTALVCQGWSRVDAVELMAFAGVVEREALEWELAR